MTRFSSCEMNSAQMKKNLKILPFLVVSIYALLTMAGCVTQRDFVWPMSVEEKVDRPVPPGASLVWITSEDTNEKVEGWFFPAPDATATDKAPALIFFHGNNEVMDHCLEFPETYSKYGISVLLVEYRGYGRSEGAPGKERVRSDMIKFHEWLLAQDVVDPQKIVYQGRSIGGAVAADLAEVRPPAAMILTSTFTSMQRMFWRFGVPGFIASDKYRTKEVIQNLDIPVLVMHGKRDNIIPVNNGRDLGSARDGIQYIEYDANHDLPVVWSEFERHLIDFLRENQIL